MVRVTAYETADYLDSPETIAAYLTEAFDTNDSSFIAMAIGTVAKAKGMTQVAVEAGLSRESLYKSLSGQAKPEFDTVRKVLGTFGVKLVAAPTTAA